MNSACGNHRLSHTSASVIGFNHSLTSSEVPSRRTVAYTTRSSAGSSMSNEDVGPDQDRCSGNVTTPFLKPADARQSVGGSGSARSGVTSSTTAAAGSNPQAHEEPEVSLRRVPGSSFIPNSPNDQNSDVQWSKNRSELLRRRVVN